MSNEYSKKTVLKVIALICLISFFAMMLYSNIDIHNYKSTQDSVNIFALSINKEESILKVRIVMPKVKKEKLKINGISPDTKSKELLFDIPLYKLNSWPFYKYEYNINIEDTSTRFSYNFINTIDNIKLTSYSVISNNKTIGFVIVMWVLMISVSLMLLFLVGEVWLRRKGGTILQLIFSMCSIGFIFVCDRIIEKKVGSFLVNNFMTKWALICNSTCLSLLFAIFIFRSYNEKFVNAERTDKAEYKQTAVI